jgi:hypothetical protein
MLVSTKKIFLKQIKLIKLYLNVSFFLLLVKNIRFNTHQILA